MLTFIKPFWAICLLRLGPQDLPASRFLLGVTLATNLVCRTAVGGVYFSFPDAVAVATANLIIVFAMVAALLQQNGKAERIVQTVTALAGVGTLLNLIALPLTVAIVAAQARGADTASIELLILALMCWNWAIVAHVLKHALSIRFGTGAVIALVLIVVTYLILSAMFPDPAMRTIDASDHRILMPSEDPLR